MGILGFDRFNGHAKTQVHAFLAHFLFSEPADITIKPTQEQFATIQQRGLNTQSCQDAGKLYGNIAAAPHHGLLGQLWQVEHLVGGEDALLARHVRNDRPATRGNSDVSGPVRRFADHHCVGV